MKTYDELKQISNFKSICLIAHISPDADALASMIVFADFLKSYFNIETVDIFAECQTPPRNCLEMLKNNILNPETKEYDVAIMMDCPNSDRLGIYKSLFVNSNLKIVIDHHKTNLFEGKINIVEQQSSTCEIIYAIIKHFNCQIKIEHQSKLYAGIITDTNNLTVGNFNSKTFKIISEIIDNIDHESIYDNFFGNNTLKNMQLLALAINNITQSNNGEIIISHITHEEANKFNAIYDDYTGIVNRLSTINNSLITCFIYPKEDNYYVSMRCKRGISVSSIAKANGGGGHDGAAAFISNNPLIEIEKNLQQSFSKILQNSKCFKKSLF